MTPRTPHIPRTILLASSMLVLLATACGDDDSSTDTTPVVTEPPGTEPSPTEPSPTEPAPTEPDDPGLADRVFLSGLVDGRQLVDGSQIRLSFDGANIGADGGCNQLGGSWSLDGDVLVVGPMSMTEMACEPAALMEQDAWLAAFLSSRPTVAVDGDTLTLTGADATITLVDREVADPDRQLEGPAWVLQAIIDGDSVSSVPAGVNVPMLHFVDSEILVESACNTGSAAFTAADGELTIEPLVMTRIACADPDATAVEDAIITTLDGTVTYEIEADDLTITHGDQGLQFLAMDEGTLAG